MLPGAGAALLGLWLLGLVLYLVPAGVAVTLAWLAVGATAAWWGLRREPPEVHAPSEPRWFGTRAAMEHCSPCLRRSQQ